MTRINIRGGGFPELQSLVGKVADDVEREVSQALHATGLEVRGDIIKRMNKKGKGTTYFRIPGEKYMTIRAGSADGPIVAVFKNSGKANLSARHTASAPGDAPAKDTGKLSNSITFEQINRRAVRIFSNVIYAKWLEFGTRKIAPRPSFKPAALAARDKLRARIEAAVARATR